MTYIFGDEKTFKCSADDYESAVEIFNISCLFPESYSAAEFLSDENYDSERNDYYPDITDDLYIPVYTETGENRESILFRKLPVKSVLDFNYDKFGNTSLKLSSGIGNNSISDSLPDIPSRRGVSTKNAAREILNDLEKRKSLLRQQMELLEKQTDEFEQILEQKQKQVFAMKTYLGGGKNILQLLSGSPAPSGEKLAIYQQKLYMDEEVALTAADGNEFTQGIDFEQIGCFDEWIKKHYMTFLPREKSVMAWQVRRHVKDYHTDAIMDSFLNSKNFKAYFLIRNGDNLYRLLSTVAVPDCLFPAGKTGKNSSTCFDIKEDKEKQEIYSLIAVQLQGLFDFSNIVLGSGNKFSLFSADDRVDYIRNMETECVLGDGHESWYNFVIKNEETLRPGCRIMIRRDARLPGRFDNKTPHRTTAAVTDQPDKDVIYVIEEKIDDKYTHCRDVRDGRYKIFFRPKDDEIWTGQDCHKRKTRVGYWLYAEEMLNIDEITPEDISYYINTRFYRSDYCRMIPTMKQLYKLLCEEKDSDRPFILLLEGQTGASEEQCAAAVREWKTKNKWRRNLTYKNDGLAYRMCKKYLETGRW